VPAGLALLQEAAILRLKIAVAPPFDHAATVELCECVEASVPAAFSHLDSAALDTHASAIKSALMSAALVLEKHSAKGGSAVGQTVFALRRAALMVDSNRSLGNINR
jgi:hypothetical protein